MEVDGICWLRHKGQEVVRVYFILNRISIKTFIYDMFY